MVELGFWQFSMFSLCSEYRQRKLWNKTLKTHLFSCFPNFQTVCVRLPNAHTNPMNTFCHFGFFTPCYICYNFRALRTTKNSCSCEEFACFTYKKVRFVHINLFTNIITATIASNIQCLSPLDVKCLHPPLSQIFVSLLRVKLFVPPVCEKCFSPLQ